MVHIYNEILPSHTTEQHLVDKNGPRDCHTEWSKSGREKYGILTHICGI